MLGKLGTSPKTRKVGLVLVVTELGTVALVRVLRLGLADWASGRYGSRVLT